MIVQNRTRLTACIVWILSTTSLFAQDASVEELVKSAQESIAVVSFKGRDGRTLGLGTGFVVSKDGLIATNLHVIGEARPVQVEFANGDKFDVTEIHATEKSMDLAIIRIDAKNLKPLKLGNSTVLKQGEKIVALGNPRGLKYSVVSGVLSGRREIDGKPMLQLAIPIEQGNSGGPVLDMKGNVHGVVTLKSQITNNLGFAVEINALKPLLEKPNRIPMSRWLTVGALDPKEWTTAFGAAWRQRAGRIIVEGKGSGFGGRSLCLSSIDASKRPIEIAVTVKIKEADGAAGLIFHSDGNDKHYGFYPSSGNMRFSRFDGPDVFSWNVLNEIKTPHLRKMDEWNRLKVRLDGEKIQCFLNDELIVESTDSQYKSGKVGIAKFRHTSAEFKHFRVAESIPTETPSPEEVARINEVIASISTDSPKRPPRVNLLDKILGDNAKPTSAQFTADILRREAIQLEQRVEYLKRLAQSVHERAVKKELVAVSAKEDASEIDLIKGALLIARLDNTDVDVAAYISEFQRLVETIRKKLPEKGEEAERFKKFNDVFFNDLGFHGSRTNYYARSNSYMNEVIDDREGLPIMLSVLYMEIAQELKLNVVGVGLPGHFVVRYEPQDGESKLIDVFEGGNELSKDDADQLVRRATGRKIADADLAVYSNRSILVRMLANLRGLAEKSRDAEAVLKYVDAAVLIAPDELGHRAQRIMLSAQTGRYEEALADIDYMLEKEPDGLDTREVRRLRARIQRSVQKQLAE
ncbi:MAG: hypothetical protein CMJ78_01815 [Planctomycetaceae bacterium]|nr:hypothetical protein [Planctomycetaceae bacterium]